MIYLKVATVFLLALAVRAEKKIELQDIEEDNLRSEKEKDLDKSDSPQTSDAETGPSGFSALDFMKSGLLRYFENPPPLTKFPLQQQRYVHQYAVTEQPERHAPAPSEVQYGPPRPQQAMVGYLSNIPMQIYLVPQQYAEQSGQPHQPQVFAEYQHPGLARLAAYQSAPEAVQTQNNYVEVPRYVPPTGKTYLQNYAPPAAMTYVTVPAQASVPTPTVAPVVTYQLPIFQYNPALVLPTSIPNKSHYQNPEFSDTNSVDVMEQEQKQYSTQTEVPYQESTEPEFPRHYNSRTPIRHEFRHHGISELPHPNPLLLKAPPPHLAHIPKSLPVYRPLTKPVYQGGHNIPNSFNSRPHDHIGLPFKRRPSSLLDSYIPSSVQLEYLKRGLVKEPLAAYEALASGRVPHPIPRHFERGFLPNQVYHTAAGGVTYGHYKRTPKVESIGSQK